MLNVTHSSSDQAAKAAAFAETLKAEQQTLSSFVQLLQTEQEILMHGDIDQLVALTPEKANHIDLLTVLGAQRKRHLATENVDDNAAGIAAWLAHNHGFTAAVRNIWNEVHHLTESAQQLNQNIGILIQTRMQQNQIKLRALHAAASPGGIYGADGQVGSLRTTRTLGDA